MSDFNKISPVLGFRSITWESDHIKYIDQRLLPSELKFRTCSSVEECYDAIKSMAIRGAPAIGVCGAFGMLLGFKKHKKTITDTDTLIQVLRETKDYLDESRPTAVNLMWATNRIIEVVVSSSSLSNVSTQELYNIAVKEALKIAEDDVFINKSISENGYSLFKDIDHCINVIHHCNTGALATVDIGTALGVIYGIHNHNKDIHVYVDETRPRLQGAKLTAWELKQAHIPFHLMVDGASGLLMRTHKIDAVLFGADRVTLNGDVANKIGTYNLAVVAHENHVPVYACVPLSTIDCSISSGEQIPIEERNSNEVTTINAISVSPENIDVYNPAFDITPHQYITAIITEKGILYPPFNESIKNIFDSIHSQ